MGTRFQRPAGQYDGATGLANRTKYQIDATSVPAVPIDDIKVDGDINYAIDALNTLDDSITSLVAGSIPDGSITTAKLADSAVTSVKVASGLTRSKLATGTANRLVGNDSSGAITEITVGSELTVSSSSLTITSAGITNNKLAAGSVDGSKFANQSANTVLAGPSSGSSTAPTFRSLAFADLPSVAYNNMQVFTSSGTFTPAAGVTKVYVEVWGAGGGGGGTSNATGAGGGGGAYSAGFLTVTPSTGHTVTVGTGGTAGSSGGGTGGTGGTSSFAGKSVTAQSTGGAGGVGGAYNTYGAGGSGGVASGGTINISGDDGDYSVTNSGTGAYSGGNGGSAPRGGFGARMAASLFTGGNGATGKSPGGGGSGGAGATKTGGAGANGMVVVYYP